MTVKERHEQHLISLNQLTLPAMSTLWYPKYSNLRTHSRDESKIGTGYKFMI